MKIAIASDLHLEFNAYQLPQPEADVLVLAGDILVADYLKSDGPNNKTFRNFLEQTKMYKHVIAVAGNHEFYGGHHAKTLDLLRNTYAQYGIHFLENDCVTLEGIKFAGCTLWTNCNNYDPLTLYHLAGSMNDFKLIRTGGYRKFSPTDAAKVHDKSRQYLNIVKPDVIVTHHAPSFQSIPQYYINDQLMNGGYASNLPIHSKLWIHGHIHDPVDYIQEDTRVVSNPRGYDNIPYKPRILTLNL